MVQHWRSNFVLFQVANEAISLRLFNDFTIQAANSMWLGERACVAAAKEQAKMF